MGSDPSNANANDNSAQFVWVEFDPYCNPWENSNSTCDHVGINVNSLASIENQPWLNDMSSERERLVCIDYDSASHNLSVSLAGFQNNTAFEAGLFHMVDLREDLPEWVILGFAAATGEVNTVKSWMFNSSNLQDDENNGLPPNKIGLVVGLVGGISVLITLFVTLAFVLWRKKKNKGDKGEELGFSVDMNHDFDLGKASKESDVFSFGVVALEIACGRKSIDYEAQEKPIWLLEWIWELYGTGTFLEAVDPHLGLKFDENEANRLMIVGLWCVHPDSKLRPRMRQVMQVLNSEQSLPVLPSKMPVASYFTTGMPSLCGGSNVDLSLSSSYLYGR
ncbi:hypothetical protein L1987_55321 [Smallanthus sonchifolius]|uniref:Uncharacterized protein n=1 Tax=Smallanthus sonchifolius TaxID=185202 RepID=A0ACB9E9B1_9ASTR|nr:hypothetical protein L1987_55321 [Smallanthus sonchifolius]